MVRSAAKAYAWKIADSGLFRGLERWWYTSAYSYAPAHAVSCGSLLIAPPGGGNIGDQAMFEAYLRNTTGIIRTAVSSADSLKVPADLAHRVEVHAFPGLFQGKPQLTPSNIRRFVKLLHESNSIVVIGADIVDGAYGRRQAWARAEAVRLALRLGKDARVVGFSWSPKADPVIEKAYRSLSRRSATLLVRDRYSHQRLAAAGIKAKLVPDTVFALQYCAPNLAATERVGAVKGPLVLLNVSGFLRRHHDLRDQYCTLIREVKALGYNVLVVPHVFREKDDDLAAAREVLALLRPGEAELVDSPLSPSEVQRLAASASLTITGRMHLGILGLTVGTPAIVFGSQGKVEGMMALFGLEHYVVQPGPNLATEAVRCVRHFHENSDTVVTSVTARLPKVITDAAQNFE